MQGARQTDAEAGWCPSQADVRRATQQIAAFQRP
jgi:hypothetical protein